MSFECANPEFHVPHKPYYLRSTANALDEIRSVTNNLQNIPSQFNTTSLEFRLILSKGDMIYGQFDGPSNRAVVQDVNGDGGFFLNKTFHETAIDFIWWDQKNCQYLFWGSSKKRVINAMNRIRDRIMACVKNYTLEKEAACPPSPSPFQSRPLLCDIAATPPPPSEYISSRQNSVLYSEKPSCTRARVYDERAIRSRSPSPAPAPQRIFRSIGEAHYYDEWKI